MKTANKTFFYLCIFHNTNNIQGMRICEKFSFCIYLSFYALIMAEMTIVKVSLLSFEIKL